MGWLGVSPAATKLRLRRGSSTFCILLETMLMERTFVMFKPDCLERGLLGRMVSRFEEKGLRLVAMKMLRVTPALAKQHYAEHVEKPFYPNLEQFITASPVVATVFQGRRLARSAATSRRAGR
jgi:nucleoside diphosphate kinase